VFLVQFYPCVLVYIKVQLNTHSTVPYCSFASIDRAYVMCSIVSSHFHILLSVSDCNIFCCVIFGLYCLTLCSYHFTFSFYLQISPDSNINITSSLISCISNVISRMQKQRMLKKQTTTATIEGTRKGQDQAKDAGTELKWI
jgi:hypothetical protein